jgi:hypothetical protein
MSSLEVLKRDFINMHQHSSRIKRGFVMKIFVPIKPKDIASYECKELEFMLIHQKDTESATRRSDRSDSFRHRREVESC